MEAYQAIRINRELGDIRVGVTINEKRALFWSKMYPLSGDRLWFGSFFYRKVVGFYSL